MDLGECRRILARARRQIEAYLGQDELAPRPVTLLWGESAANSAVGQLLILSTLNQIARFARSISFVGPDSPLLVPTLVPAPSFRDALVGTARAIDPFVAFPSDRGEESIAIGFGRDAPASADLYVGGEDWDAVVSTDAADLPAWADPPLASRSLPASLLRTASAPASTSMRRCSSGPSRLGPWREVTPRRRHSQRLPTSGACSLRARAPSRPDSRTGQDY